MLGGPSPGAPAPAQQQAADPNGQKPVDDQERAHVKTLLERIDTAKRRHEDQFKRFETNRQLLRGKNLRANLYFANLATMRPQVYAKDPEYACNPTPGVNEAQLPAVRKFCTTATTVLSQCLVKEARLKKRAKRLLTSAYVTAVGWWKCSWQETPPTDPMIENRLKDSQDNLTKLQAERAGLDDQSVGSSMDLKQAEIGQTLAGLQSQSEITVARGLALDFVMSEDMLVLDESVRELGDYTRASALAHGLWMTRDKYRETFGAESKKGRSYIEQQSGGMAAGGDRSKGLLRVWEIWDQDRNRVYTVCEGEEGYCKPPSSPDWTGQRWYPFFALAFNEIEGTFYPLSDVELTQPQVDDINEAQTDFKRDRKACLPLNVARKGGSLTPDDVDRISKREGGDLIVVEGVGGRPLSDDIWSGQLGTINAENYDTSAARAFMEQIIGGGDAARGGVLKAKTATEAEILAQGLRGRSAERTDTMEDLLTELGEYALQVLLRKLTTQEVQRIAGPDAVWPSLTVDQIFEQVTLEVRGGSTGKPDRLQEQDRWTKLMPVIQKTMEQVADLRSKGQHELAGALVELTRETLRRFDERIDIEQFLPAPGKDGQPDPLQAAAEGQQAKQQLEVAGGEMKRLQTIVDKGFIQAAASVATSPDPATAGIVFVQALANLEAAERAIATGQPFVPQPMPQPMQPPMQPGAMPPGMPMPAPQSAPPNAPQSAMQ